ncbi:MAG: hypothetical protein K0Q74_870 [Gammaproteobacteria bacterium]|jgi:hypothetical protein|nr:hypothetical protein [Gammaproteobacteria bacterium]
MPLESFYTGQNEGTHNAPYEVFKQEVPVEYKAIEKLLSEKSWASSRTEEQKQVERKMRQAFINTLQSMGVLAQDEKSVLPISEWQKSKNLPVNQQTEMLDLLNKFAEEINTLRGKNNWDPIDLNILAAKFINTVNNTSSLGHYALEMLVGALTMVMLTSFFNIAITVAVAVAVEETAGIVVAACLGALAGLVGAKMGYHIAERSQASLGESVIEQAAKQDVAGARSSAKKAVEDSAQAVEATAVTQRGFFAVAATLKGGNEAPKVVSQQIEFASAVTPPA